MKKFLFLALIPAIFLVGCGADEDYVEEGTPGTKDKGYDSNTEREFRTPDEFYDFGDYDHVKVFRLEDGTRCVLTHNNNQGGAGITCDWDDSSDVPTDDFTTETE